MFRESHIDELLEDFAPLRPIVGCPELRAHQTEDVFSLWQAWEGRAGRQAEPPFWAVAWPASAVLARHVLETPTLCAGRRIVDLGCGGGVAALGAAKAGAAHVLANDIDPIALWVTTRNAQANDLTLTVSSDDLTSGDWPSGTDLILVADMFYQRQVAERTIESLRRARRRGIEVLIGDAERPFAPREGVEILRRERMPVSADLEGVESREVKLLRMV